MGVISNRPLILFWIVSLMPTFRYLMLILIFLTLPSCVGYISRFPETKNNISLDEEKQKQMTDDYVDDRKVKQAMNNEKVILQERVGDNSWCGITVFAIIPIPLMLPVCQRKVEYILSNQGNTVLKNTTNIRHNIATCGPLVWIGSTKNNLDFCINGSSLVWPEY